MPTPKAFGISLDFHIIVNTTFLGMMRFAAELSLLLIECLC